MLSNVRISCVVFRIILFQDFIFEGDSYITRILKRDLLNFSEKISAGLTRPTMKFIANMLYGLIVSQSIMLTDIGRALNEDIKLKKKEDRLSRNLKPLCQDMYRTGMGCRSSPLDMLDMLS